LAGLGRVWLLTQAPGARRAALEALIPRVLAAGAGTAADAEPSAAHGERLAGLDRGRLLGLMQDRTSSHLMEARPPASQALSSSCSSNEWVPVCTAQCQVDTGVFG